MIAMDDFNVVIEIQLKFMRRVHRSDVKKFNKRIEVPRLVRYYKQATVDNLSIDSQKCQNFSCLHLTDAL